MRSRNLALATAGVLISAIGVSIVLLLNCELDTLSYYTVTTLLIVGQVLFFCGIIKELSIHEHYAPL